MGCIEATSEMAEKARQTAESVGCNLFPDVKNGRCNGYRRKIGLPGPARQNDEYAPTTLNGVPAICIHCNLYATGKCSDKDTVVTPSMPRP